MGAPQPTLPGTNNIRHEPNLVHQVKPEYATCRVLAGNSRFCAKKGGLRILCKLHAIKAKAGLGCALKNVLTAKKGLFLGVLPVKQEVRANKKAFYFELCHGLVVFFVCKSLSVRIFQKIQPCKKNRAEKPIVGFLFLAGSGNIAA
jgi:hypothetical protein